VFIIKDLEFVILLSK